MIHAVSIAATTVVTEAHVCENLAGKLKKLLLPDMKMAHIFTAVLLLSATVAVGSTTTGPWNYYCSAGNYTADSSYEANLKLLFSGLQKKMSTAATLFARNSVRSDLGETVYAVVQCQGDTQSSACNRCVSEAFQDAQEVCPYKKGAAIFQDLCAVRFSNETLSWGLDVKTGQNILATQVGTPGAPNNTEQFAMGVDALITAVDSMAANSSSRFATALANIDVDRNRYKAYSLAQCVGEMAHAECGMCLQALSSFGLMVGRKATTWCSFRLELYQFFTGDPMLIMPRFPPVVPPKGNNKKDTKRKEKIIWGVVGSLLVIIITLALVFAFYWRRKNKIDRVHKRLPCLELHCWKDHTIRPLWDKCPPALDCMDQITAITQGMKIALFLDYDGTLSPFKKNPAKAFMPPAMRDIVRRGAQFFPTSVVSGRSLEKLKGFVLLDELHYAGSHGMEMKMSYETESYTPAWEYEPIITEATNALKAAVSMIPKASVENNVFCVSVHYREVKEKDWGLVADCVRNVSADYAQLIETGGHMVIELRPNMKWDKGDAVRYLLQKLIQKHQLESSEIVPIYIGDDKTDEDAFKVIRQETHGIGIVVSKAPRPTDAYFSLKNPPEVLRFLQCLVASAAAGRESAGAIELA